MTRAELVERMARAIFDLREDEGATWACDGTREIHRAEATAALAAIEAAGFVCVPREATREMLLAPLHIGRPWEDRDPLGALPRQRVMESRVDLRPMIYRAMLAASPLAQEACDAR